MRIVAACFIVAGTIWAQDPELGRIEISSLDAVLTVDSPRPVDSAAKTLAQRYSLIVNAEDPPYFSGDHVPKGGRIEVHFPVTQEGSPRDVRGLLQAVVDAANSHFPFAYRLDVSGLTSTFVPANALLDRKVVIPRGTRKIIDHVKLMTDSLSAQTGFQVSCCQAVIAGYPWGMENVTFEAQDESARSVLLRLIAETKGRYYYLQRCAPVSPGRQTFCFINLQAVP